MLDAAHPALAGPVAPTRCCRRTCSPAIARSAIDDVCVAGSARVGAGRHRDRTSDAPRRRFVAARCWQLDSHDGTDAATMHLIPTRPDDPHLSAFAAARVRCWSRCRTSARTCRRARRAADAEARARCPTPTGTRAPLRLRRRARRVGAGRHAFALRDRPQPAARRRQPLPGPGHHRPVPGRHLRPRAALSRPATCPATPRSPRAATPIWQPYHAALRGELARLRGAARQRRAVGRAFDPLGACRASSRASCPISTSAPPAARAAIRRWPTRLLAIAQRAQRLHVRAQRPLQGRLHHAPVRRSRRRACTRCSSRWRSAATWRRRQPFDYLPSARRSAATLARDARGRAGFRRERRGGLRRPALEVRKPACLWKRPLWKNLMATHILDGHAIPE